LGHNYISTEHILLGLVRENEGVAARILLDFDADAETVRNEIIRMLSRPGRRQESVACEPTATRAAPRVESRIRRWIEWPAMVSGGSAGSPRRRVPLRRRDPARLRDLGLKPPHGVPSPRAQLGPLGARLGRARDQRAARPRPLSRDRLLDRRGLARRDRVE